MSRRVYGPVIARFLSSDPYVQAPESPQNYNRYSYCLNNPLKYTDPTGAFWHIVVGGVAGGEFLAGVSIGNNQHGDRYVHAKHW